MGVSMPEQRAAVAEPTQTLPDVRALIRRGYVVCVGQLASMTREQFSDVVETRFGFHVIWRVD